MPELESKYIGVRPKEKGSNGNLNLVFEKQEDGMYRCIDLPNYGAFTEAQIQHDLRKGYLKPIK